MNHLGIPQSRYGTAAVDAGNLIFVVLKKNHLKARYDEKNHHIVVLESSDLPIPTLDKIFRGSDHLYDGYYPKVQSERDEKGNILIHLVTDPNMTSYSREIEDRQRKFNALGYKVSALLNEQRKLSESSEKVEQELLDTYKEIGGLIPTPDSLARL